MHAVTGVERAFPDKLLPEFRIPNMELQGLSWAVSLLPAITASDFGPPPKGPWPVRSDSEFRQVATGQRGVVARGATHVRGLPASAGREAVRTDGGGGAVHASRRQPSVTVDLVRDDAPQAIDTEHTFCHNRVVTFRRRTKGVLTASC